MGIPNRRQGLLIGLLGFALFLQWQLIPIPPPVAVPARASETWELPKIAQAQPEKVIEILAKTNPWGRLQVPGAAAATIQPIWRVVGIVRVGPERIVVIQADQQPERQLKAGDALPGGGKILKVEEDSFVVLDNGTKRTIEIYQQGSLSL